MRIKILFLLITLFLVACQKIDIIKVKNIERGETKIVVSLENKSNNNYYILAPQCQIDDSGYYFHGKLDSLDYTKSKLLDSLIYNIYKGDRISIPIVLIPAKNIKKITFKYDKNVNQYPTTTLYFPFNMKQERLKILANILKNKKIISGYNFYLNEIENKIE